MFQKSERADVEAALDAAARAYERWRLVPAPKRAEALFRAAQLIVERKETFARDMTREMGKVLSETRGDVQEAIDMTFYMAGEGRRMFGQTVPSELRNKFAMSVRQPLGVSSVITPWNFPMAIPSWKIVPALVCGNTVVFKPASQTPLSAVNFVKVLEEAGIPRGVVNMVTGDGDAVGTPLTTDPRVRVVSFTGSTHVGRIVNQAAAPGFKKVHLEMGGKNVIMIMDDADLELAVDGCLWGGFGTTGQRCTAASRVVVHEKVYRSFVDQFVARAAVARRRGRPAARDPDGAVEQREPAADGHEVRAHRTRRRRHACDGWAPAGGGRLRARILPRADCVHRRAARHARSRGKRSSGRWYRSFRAARLDEAIEIGNNVEYGLSASIYTQDINRAFAAMRDLYTGIFYVNAPTIGAEVHLPFGGTKNTGNGHREAGVAALDVFSEWKSIYIDFSGKLQRAQIDVENL